MPFNWGQQVAAQARPNFARFRNSTAMTPPSQQGGLASTTPRYGGGGSGGPFSLGGMEPLTSGAIPSANTGSFGTMYGGERVQPGSSGAGGFGQMYGGEKVAPHAGISSSPSSPAPPNGGGEVFGLEDGGAIPDGPQNDRNTLNISNALEAVDNAMRYGYKSMGIGGGSQQGFDDGGEVDDDSSPQEAIPTQEPSGLSDDQASSQADAMQTPTQGQDANGNAQKLVGLVQGAGAMPPEEAASLMQSTGTGDPDLQKLKVAEHLADQPDKLWAFMQHLRQSFNLERAAAAVKLKSGHVAAGLQTAEEMLGNVLDGTYTSLKPNNQGAAAEVKNVEDDKPLGQFQISPEALYGFLTGPDGGYDQIHNNNIVNTLKKLASGMMQQSNNSVIRASNAQGPGYVPGGNDLAKGNMGMNPVSAGAAQSAAYGVPNEEDEGTPQATPQVQPSPQAGGTTPAAPPPGRRPLPPVGGNATQNVVNAQRALGGQPPQQQAQAQAQPQQQQGAPAAGEDPYDLPAATKARLEAEAHKRFPWISQQDQKYAWIDAQEKELMGMKSKTDVANITSNWRTSTAQTRADALVNAHQVDAQSRTEVGRTHLQGVLAGVAATNQNARVKAVAEQLRQKLANSALGGEGWSADDSAMYSNLMKSVMSSGAQSAPQQSQQSDDQQQQQQRAPAPKAAAPKTVKVRMPDGTVQNWTPVRNDQVNSGL